MFSSFQNLFPAPPGLFTKPRHHHPNITSSILRKGDFDPLSLPVDFPRLSLSTVDRALRDKPFHFAPPAYPCPSRPPSACRSKGPFAALALILTGHSIRHSLEHSIRPYKLQESRNPCAERWKLSSHIKEGLGFDSRVPEKEEEARNQRPIRRIRRTIRQLQLELLPTGIRYLAASAANPEPLVTTFPLDALRGHQT